MSSDPTSYSYEFVFDNSFDANLVSSAPVPQSPELLNNIQTTVDTMLNILSMYTGINVFSTYTTVGNQTYKVTVRTA